MGLKGRSAACSMCGGEMVPERRRPTTGAPMSPGERRDLVAVRETAAHGARPTA